MDLKEQKYVCTLAECKSLTRASERLYISQPALSLYINNVEKILGARLFERNGRKFELTWLGKQYVEKASQMLNVNLDDLKIITCHLGNGSSITAIKDGKVIDTSMGLTPLDGFIMGSRCGGVDPSAITYLQKKEGWTPAETAEILNKKSGVLGISGISSDDRDVLAAAEAGNERAALARSIQRYQIRKFIGAYVAAMDGVDAIVFTGGIGENTCDLREDVCKHLTYLGVKIDCEKNLELRKGKEGELSTPDSKVRVFVLPTNEELLIARDTKAIAEKL